jgi:hypothetical protein
LGIKGGDREGEGGERKGRERKREGREREKGMERIIVVSHFLNYFRTFINFLQFSYALENTNGHDLDKVLWRKSKNSEVWLERRTNYTRSLAVMSMVGYILGLGDRHPSNLMLDRLSGRISFK